MEATVTTLIFTDPVKIEMLTDVLKKLDVVTPDTSLRVGLKDNSFVTKIDIFPTVPSDKSDDMKKLAEEFGATLEM